MSRTKVLVKSGEHQGISTGAPYRPAPHLQGPILPVYPDMHKARLWPAVLWTEL